MEIKEVNTLFGLKGVEGDLVKWNKEYFVYVENFDACEKCGNEVEEKVWTCVTDVVNKIKDHVITEFELLFHKR